MHPEVAFRQTNLRRNLDNLVAEMTGLATQYSGSRDYALGWLERADMVARVVASIPESGDEPIERFPFRLERRTDL